MTILNDPVSAKLGDRAQLSYIASQAADARLNVELETEGMTLNIGPQHPATQRAENRPHRGSWKPGYSRDERPADQLAFG